jgi:glycosyltransferase involved in cell wall biosynthesis
MKILQVVPVFSPMHGGSSAVPYILSKELAKRGHEVTIYTSDYRICWEWVESLPQVNVCPFKTRSSLANFYVTPRMMNRTREEIKSFDVIHLHDYRTFQNIIMSRYAKKYDVPYVLHAHGALHRIVEKRRLKWIYDVSFGYELLKDASKVIALSQAEFQQYRVMYVSREKIAVIPNGMDLSEFADLPPRDFFKNRFNISEEKKMILYLGRIHRTKGIEFLVNAYAHLVKNMKSNNALLVIAGPDDGFLGQLKSFVSRLGLNDKVMFTNMLSEEDKVGAYVDSSIVVNVEPRNVFGLVPLEAAACSTPVIVSSGNAISEAICEGKFGFSVEYGDVFALAEIMHKMLNNDILLEEMGREGRKFIFANYDWANIVPKLEKVYEEVLRSNS